jgi:hypothetical protein
VASTSLSYRMNPAHLFDNEYALRVASGILLPAPSRHGKGSETTIYRGDEGRSRQLA